MLKLNEEILVIPFEKNNIIKLFNWKKKELIKKLESM